MKLSISRKKIHQGATIKRERIYRTFSFHPFVLTIAFLQKIYIISVTYLSRHKYKNISNQKNDIKID